MSLFEERKKRKAQERANAFIKKLNGKEIKDIEKMYLENIEFENNEIVLSYLFFNYKELIRILPLDFQVSRVNSNLSMFNYASDEAKKQIVLNWFNDNKFFMNSFVVKFTEEEYNEYLSLYFQRPDDVAKLYMEDLKKTITVLEKNDFKETINVINKIKDKLTEKQWEYIIPVNPAFIMYAPMNVQNKYSDNEKYAKYISGEARKSYITKQLKKINSNLSLFNDMDIDIQKEYINTYPAMINYIDEKVLVNLLKYDINLIKYVNIASLKDENDKSYKFLYGVLENIKSKSSSEIINLFIDKGLLNAKGKLYRYDVKSNNITYQYNKKVISIIQSLQVEAINELIKIDINYLLAYICPLYNDSMDRAAKDKLIIDCNSRCLNLFRLYYSDDKIYTEYYRIINKIFNEYLSNVDNYDCFYDYECVFELLKILFNKNIIYNNDYKKISMYVGVNLKYKNDNDIDSHDFKIKTLNEILSYAYKINIDNKNDLYDISSLELFDNRFSFISKNVLEEYNTSNYTNISTLLYIVKNDKARSLFINYYNILKKIYSDTKEVLYRAIENFTYNKELLMSAFSSKLTGRETESFINILSTYNNPLNINDVKLLNNYEIDVLKQFLKELSNIKDNNIYKNILCNYLFNRGYNSKGNSGWLDITTISQMIDVYDTSILEEFKMDGRKVFTKSELVYIKFIKKLFSYDDDEILFSFVDKMLDKKIKRNIIFANNLFDKLKKYKTYIINSSIVKLNDLDIMSSSAEFVNKKEVDGVKIYAVYNNDFKVLSSYNDDKIHFRYSYASEIDKNSYCYESIPEGSSFRFITYDNRTLLKFNKDRKKNMKAKFIIVNGIITDEIINVAKKENLVIVSLEDKL